MIRTVLAVPAWLHGQLEERLGKPYRLLIGVGLLLDLVRNCRHLIASEWAAGGLLTVVLEVALLLDAATTLHRRFEDRHARRHKP